MSYSSGPYSDRPYSDGGASTPGTSLRGKRPRRQVVANARSAPAEPLPVPPAPPSPLYDALSPQSKDKIDRLLLELREVRSMVAAQTLTVDNVGTSDGTESDGS